MGNEGTRWKNLGLTRFENTIRMVGLLGHTQLGLVCHEIVVRYFFLVLPIDEFGVGRSHLFRTRSLRSRTPGDEPDPGQVDEPTPQVRNRVAQFDYRGYGHEHGKDLVGQVGQDYTEGVRSGMEQDLLDRTSRTRRYLARARRQSQLSQSSTLWGSR
jgi:hypothetical protein